MSRINIRVYEISTGNETHCFTGSKNAGRSRLHFFQFQGERCTEKGEKPGFLSERRYSYNTHSKVAANLPREFINEDEMTA